MAWKNAKKLNRKKRKQLGCNPSTARARLLRLIVFHLLEQLDKTRCWVCGKEMTCDDWSIEHIVDWMNVDSDLFWDMDNIDFSHKKCNRPGKKTKGRID